jgi:hypothetical protein
VFIGPTLRRTALLALLLAAPDLPETEQRATAESMEA